MKIPQNTGLKSFLAAAASDHEVSLVIAADAKEVKVFEKSLVKEGFATVRSASNLFKVLGNTGRHCLIVEEFTKELYDIIVQFPTGQVELFDSAAMRSMVATPKSSVCLITTHRALDEAEKRGFAIRKRTGMAYQA